MIILFWRTEGAGGSFTGAAVRYFFARALNGLKRAAGVFACWKRKLAPPYAAEFSSASLAWRKWEQSRLFLKGLRLCLDHPEAWESQQRVTWTALALVFYIPDCLWLYGLLLTAAFFTGRKIPLPVWLWLGWSLFAAARAPGLLGRPEYFLPEILVVLSGTVTGLFLRRRRRGRRLFSVIPLPMALVGCLQAAARPFSPPAWLSPEQRGLVPFRIVGTLGNPNLFGIVLAFILPLVFSASTGGKRRFFSQAVGFLYTVALLLTFSRTAWLAAATAMLVLWGRKHKAALFRWGMLLFITFLCFQPLQVRLFPPGGLWRDSTIEYRRHVWENSWRLFIEHLPSGTGSGGFHRRYPPPGLPAAHTHNQYLQVAVEKGIPGLILFAWIIYRGLRKQPGTREGEGIRASLYGQLAAGLGESPWAHPLPLFLFWCGWAFLQEAADD